MAEAGGEEEVVAEAEVKKPRPTPQLTIKSVMAVVEVGVDGAEAEEVDEAGVEEEEKRRMQIMTPTRIRPTNRTPRYNSHKMGKKRMMHPSSSRNNPRKRRATRIMATKQMTQRNLRKSQ